MKATITIERTNSYGHYKATVYNGSEYVLFTTTNSQAYDDYYSDDEDRQQDGYDAIIYEAQKLGLI